MASLRELRVELGRIDERRRRLEEALPHQRLTMILLLVLCLPVGLWLLRKYRYARDELQALEKDHEAVLREIRSAESILMEQELQHDPPRWEIEL